MNTDQRNTGINPETLGNRMLKSQELEAKLRQIDEAYQDYLDSPEGSLQGRLALEQIGKILGRIG